MADLMRHQEGLFKGRPCIFVDDKIVFAIKNGAAAIQHIGSRRAFFDRQSSRIGFGDNKVVRGPRIAPHANGIEMKVGCPLPSKLDCVHLFAPLGEFLHALPGNPRVQQYFLERGLGCGDRFDTGLTLPDSRYQWWL